MRKNKNEFTKLKDFLLIDTFLNFSYLRLKRANTHTRMNEFYLIYLEKNINKLLMRTK
jgi:hypothetical protein